MRVIVNHNYTYETDLPVQIGDVVILPTASFLRDVKGPTFEGTVTSLTSDYPGTCARIIRIKPSEKPKPAEKPAKKLTPKQELQKKLDIVVALVPKRTFKWTVYCGTAHPPFDHLKGITPEPYCFDIGEAKQLKKAQALLGYHLKRCLETSRGGYDFLIIQSPKSKLTLWCNLKEEPPKWRRFPKGKETIHESLHPA